MPAALIGLDLPRLLERAVEMAHSLRGRRAGAGEPGLVAGRVLGELAKAGRDKLTLVVPEAIAAFGTWVEQLVAESTGKEGKGILPVEGEPLGPPPPTATTGCSCLLDGARIDRCGRRRTLAFDGPLRLGAEFFRWEFATAVAGAVLGINPFDQPNVQEAKDTTKRRPGRPASLAPTRASTSWTRCSARCDPGDYVAVTGLRRAQRRERGGACAGRAHAARGTATGSRRPRLRPPLSPLHGAVPQGRPQQRRVHPGRRRTTDRHRHPGEAVYVRRAEGGAGAGGTWSPFARTAGGARAGRSWKRR